jgi:hypothetical protein
MLMCSGSPSKLTVPFWSVSTNYDEHTAWGHHHKQINKLLLDNSTHGMSDSARPLVTVRGRRFTIGLTVAAVVGNGRSGR